MSRLVPALALVLAYAIAPGAGELTENVVQLVMTGHTAHDSAQEGHGQSGDEHGCSGPFHLCPCHGTAAFVADEPAVEVDAASPTIETIAWRIADLQSDGILAGLFRPPIA